MPFGGLTRAGPKNHVLDGGQDQTNPLTAARGERSTIRPLVGLLWTLVQFCGPESRPKLAI